jgi:hypothetical protein
MNIRLWSTVLRAVDPETMELKTWGGPNVPGLSLEDAQRWCWQNGMGYLRVIGELAAEIDENGCETDHESIRAN